MRWWIALGLVVLAASILWTWRAARSVPGWTPITTTISSAEPARDEVVAPAGASPGLARGAVEAGRATSRVPAAAPARTLRGRLVEAHCGRPIERGVRIWLWFANGATELLDVREDGRFVSTAEHS